jgi:hypothetical protein
MNTKIIVIVLFLSFSGFIIAQDGLESNRIFEKYGKEKGSTLVQLSSDVLSQGSKITFYKSLVFYITDEIEDEILTALEKDIDNGRIISETRKNGKIYILTLSVSTLNSEIKENEYMLFKMKSGKVTLVYLKGEFKPDELDNQLNRLKDLFIYVNNQRIKLQ